MTDAESADLPLGRRLFAMTWPMLFGVLSLLGFQLVDSIFIGQLGVEPLAVLGFTVPVMQLVIGTQVGIGIATTAVISRVIGAGDSVRAQRLGGLVIISGVCVILCLCVGLWVMRLPLLRAMGADPELYTLVERYWAPWLVSAWLGAVLYFGYSVFRAHGYTRLPGSMMVVTSLINLILDPLFIFGFGWGLPGAAIATVVAFGTGCVVVYRRLHGRHWLRYDVTALPALGALRQLGSIAGPAMLSQLMPPVSAMLATGLVAGFGSGAVGAWGLGTRLEFFSIVAVLALTMSMPPMIGRFLGVGDIEGIQRLVRLAVRFVIVWQLAIALVWILCHGPMASLFTEDPAVRRHLAAYLVRVPPSYCGLGVCMLMVSVCNAVGLPLRALLTSLVRLFGCFLPALWIGAQLGGLTGLFSGALVGNLAAGTLAWLLYRRGMARVAASSAAA